MLDYKVLDNGKLELKLSDSVDDYDKQGLRERRETSGWFAAMGDLLEGMTSNGWTWVHPDEIGALTSDTRLILSDDAGYDDDGVFYVAGKVWSTSDYDYAFTDEIELLLSGRPLVLEPVPEN